MAHPSLCFVCVSDPAPGVFTGKCFEAFITLVFYNASLFGGYHLLHSMFSNTSIFTHPAVSMMTLLVHTVPGLVLVLRALSICVLLN